MRLERYTCSKLGLDNERKSCIPMEILDENAQIKSQTFEV